MKEGSKMKIEKITDDNISNTEFQFRVTDITEDDIPYPSERFLAFVRSLEGLPFLNRFTIDEFISQVRKSFVSQTK
jgi:hypothetical protein